jgi:glycogen phosphorylase
MRHLEIIYAINQHFLDRICFNAQEQGEIDATAIGEQRRRLSLIDESGERSIRMAHLACVGSRAINGVAQLHTELLKQSVLRDFYEIDPDKFTNKTNGVTPRRFLVLSNPRLTDLITRKIGTNWITHLEDLKQLEAFVDDPEFCQEWREIKNRNKQDLAAYLGSANAIVNPDSLFDIQAKRIHEYKRPHLNLLHIITLYWRIKANPDRSIVPRTLIFGGKAAPGYYLAKLIIKLIHSVANVINNDPDVRQQIKVVFLKNYNVKFSQRVCPAADLSEQISLAGKEASGTGNMKLAMNGALTIGTLDGANIEIRAEVGSENFFLFGLTAAEVFALKSSGYDPGHYYQNLPELRQAIDSISSGHFSQGDGHLFSPLVNSLLSKCL